LSFTRFTIAETAAAPACRMMLSTQQGGGVHAAGVCQLAHAVAGHFPWQLLPSACKVDFRSAELSAA
jgi:hypothetical protein